jgi:hypothetical protein
MNLSEASRAVTQASFDCKSMNTERQWATLEVNWLESPQPLIAIHYGAIHSNGQRECKIATRHYYIQNNEVKYYIQGHP